MQYTVQPHRVRLGDIKVFSQSDDILISALQIYRGIMYLFITYGIYGPVKSFCTNT